jgi:DNA-binding transcriptional LysR family regulator
MDQLAAMRAFTRIVETGSFTRAAASLDMPKPSVTKLVQSLEAHLRTRLLSRTTRRLVVTTDGAAYYERALRLLSELEELDNSMTLSQVRPKGRLRIDVSAALAQRVIIPALAGFLAQYPDIQMEIGASDRPADLVAENVDCVIRAGNLVDQTLIARRIASMHMVTCASPAYLDRHGTPMHPSDLEQPQHTVVTYFAAGSGRPRPFPFTRGEEHLEIRGRYLAAANEVTTYMEAGLAGLGVLQAPLFLARPLMAEGRLRLILADWKTESIPLYIVYPPNRHISNKLRVFVDWVARLFASPEFAEE